MQIESLFKYDEIESITKSTSNVKSGGIDGVSYEDLKDSCDDFCHVLVNTMNVMLINHCLSSYWKEAVIQRIPKKKFTIEDLSTLRDISLLPVYYKILSKAICNRTIPIISSEIVFWQRAFLNKRDRQKLIYNLKIAFDDFHHKSTKFTSVL